MFGYLYLKEGIIWIFIFLEGEFVPALVALSDLSFFGVHLYRFLRLEFIGVLFSLFLLFIACHLLVHLPTGLPCIRGLHLSFLTLTQMFL